MHNRTTHIWHPEVPAISVHVFEAAPVVFRGEVFGAPQVHGGVLSRDVEHAIRTCRCQFCGVDFVSLRAHTKWCSQSCRKRAARLAKPLADDASRQAALARTRALEATVAQLREALGEALNGGRERELLLENEQLRRQNEHLLRLVKQQLAQQRSARPLVERRGPRRREAGAAQPPGEPST